MFFIFFLAYKALRAIVILYFSNFFQSSFFDAKFIPSQLYLFIDGLIFAIVVDHFLYLHDLTRLLWRIENYYLFY